MQPVLEAVQALNPEQFDQVEGILDTFLSMRKVLRNLNLGLADETEGVLLRNLLESSAKAGQPVSQADVRKALLALVGGK